ncbi:hypothetical protein Gotri_027015 [Gossypium trilobum]|uniref:Uncharacterized protein n=1 Tax=Gossypium trilobum TaxID=34281 RepID=A0A7J9FNX5_9ROSI|nr:hypothetical protein [Gossypium trilobum]
MQYLAQTLRLMLIFLPRLLIWKGKW